MPQHRVATYQRVCDARKRPILDLEYAMPVISTPVILNLRLQLCQKLAKSRYKPRSLAFWN
jgi:hypothetical protein